MARPLKEGLDYFPLDTDIDQDDKVAIIEAQHGLLGFGVVIKLLMKIYSEGYYYDWTEKEQILFSKRINVDINSLNVIINDCIKWGLFSENLFNKYKILTSAGIQRRYFEIVKRRKRVEIAKQYLMLTNDDIKSYTNIVIVNINDDGEIVDDNINSQSKVKESKVNKSKVKHMEKDDADLDNNNLQELETFYQDKLKRISSSKDLQDMVETYEKYKDIEFIKESIDKAVERNMESNGKLTINSFRYFIPVLSEEWKKKQLGGGDSGSGLKTNEGKNGKDGGSAERAGIISL